MRAAVQGTSVRHGCIRALHMETNRLHLSFIVMCLYMLIAMKDAAYSLSIPCVKGAGVRWTPLPQAKAPTEPAGETAARRKARRRDCLKRNHLNEQSLSHANA